MNITDRRADLQKRAASYHNAEFRYADQQQWHKAMTSVRLSMGDYIKSDKVRRLVLGWLFIQDGIELSTANLTQGQLEALRKWLQIFPMGPDIWTVSDIAKQELKEMAAQFEPSIVKEAEKLGGKINEPKQVHAAKPASYFTFEP